MHFNCTIICKIVKYISQLLSPWAPDYTNLVCIDDNPHIIYRLMHDFFHISTVIIPRDRYHPEDSMTFSISGLLSSRETDTAPRVDIGRGMITVLIWKKVCINLFITYFNIELKRTKLTSHTHQTMSDSDIGWGMITVLIWKRAWIVLLIKRLDIMLSEFCPDICPCTGIAVALPVFTYEHNWHYYL